MLNTAHHELKSLKLVFKAVWVSDIFESGGALLSGLCPRSFDAGSST